MQRSILIFFFVVLAPVSYSQTDTTVYDTVDVMPRWIGCDSGMNEQHAKGCFDKNWAEFLEKNIKYPYKVGSKTLGQLWIGIIIETDGSVSKYKIYRDLNAFCDEEALRVIKLLPIFTSGLRNGKPVRVQLFLPIYFRREEVKVKATY